MKKKGKGAGENTGLPLKADQQVQEVRSQAERVIRQQDALPPVDLEKLTPEQSQKLLYELQVHQVELTMQNEELRAIQMELEKSRSRYFELYDLAPVGYLTVSEQGLITLANLTFATLLGVKRIALENTLLSRYILKEDQDIYYRHRKKLFESGEDQQCELRMVKSDGIAFWAKLQATFVPVEDGVPFCRLTLSDITENKNNEEKIEQHEVVLSAIYENTPLILMLVDSDRKVRKINSFGVTFADKAMEDIFGKRGGEALGCLYALEHPEGCGKGPHCAECIVRITVLETIETGQAYHQVEASLPFLVDGVKEQLYFLLSTARLLVNEQQQVLVSMLDITERKNAEGIIRTLNEELEQRVKARTTELEAVNKELASFAYSISHDFRAPLRALNGFSASLTEKYNNQLDEQGLHYLTRIRNAAIYMSDLVDDLLKLSRITRTEVNEQAADISHLAEEMLKELQEAEPERRVKIKVAPGLSTKGDIALLKAALENLIDNAWKFSSLEPQAEIEVGQTAIDGEAAFFVRDNGVGFNMAYAAKLFGAFQRLHGVNEFPGTGIGLATVQRIINRHGGRIWATSEEGKGATFYFTL